MAPITNCIVAAYTRLSTVVAGTECPRPAIWFLVAGCVHEHLDRGGVCDYHRQWFTESGEYCNTCYLVDGHHCDMRLEFSPLTVAG